MRHSTINETARSWVVDYSAARARAIEWLGDRYLLAKPINTAEHPWRRASSANSPAPESSRER